MILLDRIISASGVFFLIYLLGYATFLMASVVVGAQNLYKRDRMIKIKNELKHDYYLPISIVVPAYNEEITIVDTVISLLNMDYHLYEIIVVDDGSKDGTMHALIDHFQLKPTNRPIRRMLACKPYVNIYETRQEKVKITLIQKENGGKGDALNMGINASDYPYYLCIDADSMLQRDSLERIIQPVMEDDRIVAVGGLVRVAQCVALEGGEVKSYHLPWNPITCMQVMEYDRSFLAARILMDRFNGNLIISGAFGLFKKDIVVAVGGYDDETLGEDMELVVRLHTFCKKNAIPYSIRYEPNAICWSQTPSALFDLIKQRRRWHLGLFQSMVKYRQVFANWRFGFVSIISYMYYLLYELCSPFVEVLGLATIVMAWLTGLLNLRFTILFFLLYAVYGVVLTLTAFFQRIYTQGLKITPLDVVKAVTMCLLENVFFRFILAFTRVSAFIGYKKRKRDWGEIKRTRQKQEE